MSDARTTRATACALAALGVLAFGLYAMLQAPQVPYADAWRFLGHFLSLPFPRNVLGADNGHMELIPDLIRVAELEWFAADQRLQMLIGILLALASWLWMLLGLRGSAVESSRFWAIALLLALGLFWLGNYRALTHANETVHAYAVTLGLFGGVLLAWRGGVPATMGAALCAVLASLSFGSGLAVFPAVLLVLALRRAPGRDYLPIAAALLGVFLLMLVLRDGTAESMRLPDPLGRIEALLRWLGGPALFASWPLWDPEIAARVPNAGLRGALGTFADSYEQVAGPAMLARWPHLGWGLLGVAGFGWALLRSWREPDLVRVAGTAVAAFALCVGGLIVWVRAVYFDSHPDQLLAPRYLVWSSLFWAGLGLVLMDALRPGRAALLALSLCVLTLPSQLWMYQLAAGQKQTAERSALAAAVGVIEPGLPLGETVPEDLIRALPLLRQAEAAVFAWPETRWLEHAPESARLQVLPVTSLRISVVGNRLGEPGRRIDFESVESAAERLLLIDADGVARGLARREPDGRWLGWMQGAAPTEGVQVVRLLRR